MTINISVKKSPTISVRVNNGVVQAYDPITLRTNITPNTTRLDALTDVLETNKVTGAVLVYDSGSDKYLLEKLSIDNIDGAIDGGLF